MELFCFQQKVMWKYTTIDLVFAPKIRYRVYRVDFTIREKLQIHGGTIKFYRYRIKRALGDGSHFARKIANPYGALFPILS